MIVKKPWGQEEIIEANNCYMVKRLTMRKNHRCSLQYHNFKLETIYVLSGKIKIYRGSHAEHLKVNIYGPNETLTLEPKTIHRMEAIEDSVYLEASTPEMADVVRLSDDYNRAESK